MYRVHPPHGGGTRDARVVPGSPSAGAADAGSVATLERKLQADALTDAVLCEMIAADAEATTVAPFARPTVADMARRYHILRDTLLSVRDSRSGSERQPRQRWRSPTAQESRSLARGGSAGAGSDQQLSKKYRVKVHEGGAEGEPRLGGLATAAPLHSASLADTGSQQRLAPATPSRVADEGGAAAGSSLPAQSKRLEVDVPRSHAAAGATSAPSQGGGVTSRLPRPASASTYMATVSRSPVVPVSKSRAEKATLPSQPPVSHEALLPQRTPPTPLMQQEQYPHYEPQWCQPQQQQQEYDWAASPLPAYATAAPNPHQGGSGHIVLGFSEVVSMLGRVTGDVLTQVLGAGGNPAATSSYAAPRTLPPPPIPVMPPPSYVHHRPTPVSMPPLHHSGWGARHESVPPQPASRGSSTGAQTGRPGGSVGSRSSPSPAAPRPPKPPFLPPGSTSRPAPAGGSRPATTGTPTSIRFVDPALGDSLAKLHALAHGRAPLDVTGFLRRRGGAGSAGKAAPAEVPVSVAAPPTRLRGAAAAAAHAASRPQQPAPPKWLDLSMEAGSSSEEESEKQGRGRRRAGTSAPGAANSSSGAAVHRSADQAQHETARLVAAADALLLDTAWEAAPPLSHLPPPVAPGPVQPAVSAHAVPPPPSVASAQEAALAAARQALLAYRCA